MRSASGDSRTLFDAGGSPASTLIQLVPSAPPAQKNDSPTAQAPPFQAETSFAAPSRSNEQLTALDTLYSQASARPTRPQPPPANNNTANAPAQSSGGGNIGGVSTPNAVGGGSAAASSGAGPAVTNANQFLSANLGMAGNALTPAAAPATAAPTALTLPPPATAAPPANNVAPSTPVVPPAPTGAAAPGHGQTPPSANPASPPQPLAASGGDPLYVLDTNTGETLPANSTLNTFSTWSENLLAQVSGAFVMSYSWNTSQAPDLGNLSGQNSANLQGTWASFTGATRSDTITVTETTQNYQMLSQTMTFLVGGTDSPGYSSSRPTSSASWPGVITPDQLTAQQATQPGGPYASLGLADGSVQTSFAMPSYNPNTTPVSLDYSSTAANAQPIFLAEYQLPAGQAVPSTITAQLTLNGTAGSQIVYNTSGLNPGDIVQIALQGNATGLSTGRYPWQITVTNGTNNTNYSGDVDLVNQAGSPFGAGWSLDNVAQLVPVSGSGVLLVQPGGTSLWFANGQQSGTFVTPAGDFSTLVQNQDGTYTRTQPDGTTIDFDSSGRQTATVDRDGNTTTFGYNGSGQLTTITDMNGQQTTLGYNGSGQVTTITDPANRTATLAYTGNQLTAITDPANDVWGYGYDASNDLTTLTDPNNHATTFAYNFADRVATVTQADNTTEQLTAEQMNGLAAPGTGTSSNPATAVLRATGDQAQYTDANHQVWTTGLDWLGFGLDTDDIDPLGNAALTYRDANGLAWLSADALGRATRDFFDGQGNVTEEVAPDNTTQQYSYNSFSEVTQYTDQENNVTNNAYNTKGDLTQETDALNDITTYAYNNAGLLTSETDPLNNITTYAYNTLNELTNTTNALNGVSTYAYDAAGDQTSSTDARGFTSSYAYDPMGNLTSQTLPDTAGVFSTSTFAYDKAGNQLSSTDPLGHTTTNVYNAVNELTSTTDPLGNITTYAYDNNGNLTSTSDPLGDTTTYVYDADNRQSSTSDPLGDTTTSTYDAAGEQTSMTDPLGNKTTYTYTPRGEVAGESFYNSVGSLIRSIAYTDYPCGCNESTTVSNGNGPAAGSISGRFVGSMSGSYTYNGSSVSGSFSSYDVSGSILNSEDQVIGSISGGISGTIANGIVSGSGSFTVSGQISGSGQVTVSGTVSGNSNTPPSGSLDGDLGGDIAGSISASGGVSGNITGNSDLDGGCGGILSFSGSFSGSSGTSQTTSVQRDALHRVTSMTDALGNTTTYGYDADGNQTSVTDAQGHTTTYAYNAMKGLSSTTDTLGNTTTYGYDADGNLTSVRDPLNDPTYSYDAQGRLLSETDAAGGTTSYTYDLAGNQTSITDPDGNTTSYAYDADNQVTSSTNALGYQSTDVYNAAGELIATTDADGRTIDYGYNAAGEQTSETWVGGNYTASYQYNADGELTSESDPYSSYAYTYDPLGDVTSVDNGGTPAVPHVVLTYGYDGFGNRTSLTDNDGGSLSYSYDADNQLTSMGLSTYNMPDAHVAFGYDAANRLTGMTRTGPSGSDTIASTFSYDNDDRLTNITHTDTTQNTTLASYTYGYDAASRLTSYQDANSSLTYGYDANGELTSAAGTLNGSTYSVSYSYDANGNRTMPGYVTSTNNELTSDGTYTYTYDNDGNTLTQTDIATGQVTYFTWDYENRLTEEKVENSQGQVLNDETFTYDVNDNRIGVSLNGVQQLYTVYDGSNPYMDFNGSGQLTQRYLTNPNGLNEFYGQVSASGATEWYLTDNINSIRQVVNTTGTSLDMITYDPYGNVISQTNAANDPRFGFMGTAVDSITGNDLPKYRPYGPAIGRFLIPDLFGFAAEDTDLFRYAGNNPVEFEDPSGLERSHYVPLPRSVGPFTPPPLIPPGLFGPGGALGPWTPPSLPPPRKPWTPPSTIPPGLFGPGGRILPAKPILLRPPKFGEMPVMPLFPCPPEGSEGEGENSGEGLGPSGQGGGVTAPRKGVVVVHTDLGY